MRKSSCRSARCFRRALLLACCASGVQGFAQPTMVASSAMASMQQRHMSSSCAQWTGASLQMRQRILPVFSVSPSTLCISSNILVAHTQNTDKIVLCCCRAPVAIAATKAVVKLPCLLFVNVASTLAMKGQSLKKLAVLPLFACLQIAIAAAFAAGIGKAIGTDADSRDGREMKMCSSFANSGPLPLLSHADITLLPSAVAYISFYLLGWSPMFWTAGYGILAGKPLSSGETAEEKAESYKKKYGNRSGIVKKILILNQ
eukprot:12833-Heterococcus_DN1.PRE.1